MISVRGAWCFWLQWQVVRCGRLDKYERIQEPPGRAGRRSGLCGRQCCCQRHIVGGSWIVWEAALLRTSSDA